MNKTILFLLACIPTILFGQETKKITDKETNETFYVLKSDKTTRHGEYKKVSYNNKVLVKGYYKLGIKDTIWESFGSDGQRNLKYDFSKNELISYTPNDKINDKKFRVINGSDTILSRPPILLGGDDLVLSVLVQNFRYPASALEKRKSGKVFVLFTVDRFGKTSNYHVSKPLGYGIDEEAIRILKLVPDLWLPGLSNGQPVDVEVVYPININLQ